MSVQDDNMTNLNDHEQLPWELKNNLATVSCLAAGEIDNFITGYKASFDAVERLIEMIEHSITFVEKKTMPKSMIDAAAAVAMNHAIEEYYPGLNHSPNTLEQFLKQAGEIEVILKNLIDNPDKVHSGKTEDLKRMRDLCRAFSKNVLAYEESIEELGIPSF